LGYQAGIWFAIAMSAVSTVVLYTLPVRSRT
jgi:heme exporter protein D